jgi:hypothetical protein
VDVRLYVDGEEKGTYFATSFNLDEAIEVDRAKHQGSATPSLDGTYNGARGSFEFVQDDDFSDPREVYEAQKEKLKNRLPGGVIRAVVSRRATGSQGREALRISGMIVNQTDRAGESQRWTTSWNFEAEDVKYISA